MRQSWRWFGPDDPVPLDHIRQAGADTIVTALHQIPTGEAWPLVAIKARQQEIEGDNQLKSPLYWRVVESVNVHDDIKVAAPGHEQYIENYCTTLTHLGACGIHTVCYNFMPLIDWTRTDLNRVLPSGARALGFDADRFAAFDLHILERTNAAKDYSDAELERAEVTYQAMDEAEREQLTRTILAGLPGGTTGAHDLASFKASLTRYQTVDSDTLRRNLIRFLQQVIPTAEAAGVRLAIHPDDPPRPLLGLPRVLCTAKDVRQLFQAVNHPANGLTLCAGTFGVRPDNDLPAMAEEFAERIYFSHLRGTTREANALSFFEADHLESDVDMLGLIKNLLSAERGRAESPWQQIPIRPDHGHQMLDDLDKQRTNPGYSAIGRLKGLAEIRGAIKAIERFT